MATIAGSGIWASSTGIVVSRGAISARRHGVVADGVTDNGDRLRSLAAQCASSGKILLLDEPGTVCFDQNLSINSHYMEMYPGVTLSPTDTTNCRVRITGTNCGIIGDGAKIVNDRCRQYTVTALAVVGNVGTATIPGHPYEVGDRIEFHNTVGITTSLENTFKDVTVVDGDDVSFAHTSADSSATIPYERTDGWNRGDYAIYPTARLVRTQTNSDAIVSISNATNFDVRGLELQGSKHNALHMQWAYKGRIVGIKAHDTAADGVHFTNLSSDIWCDDIEVWNTGDDGFALVGYRDSQDRVRNIHCGRVYVHDIMYNGRGLALVGTTGFRCNQYIGENIYHAGLLIFNDISSYGTLGNKDVWFGAAMLHTCGSTGAEVSGWNTSEYASLQFSGNNRDSERQEYITIEKYTCINSRNYAFSDGDDVSAVRGVNIGDIFVEGGRRTISNSKAMDGWRIGAIRGKYTASQGFIIGGANTRGRSRIGLIELRHFNFSQTRKFVDDISCVSGTVTIPVPGHGFTGQPTLWVSAVGSDANHAVTATERTMQLADEALGTYYSYTGSTSAWVAATVYALRNTVIPTVANGFRYMCTVAGTSHATTEPTWPTTVGTKVTDGTVEWVCYSRAYTNSTAVTADPDVITLVGTMLDDSNSPRIYTHRGSPSPNTYVNTIDDSNYDALQIGSIPTGAHLQIDEIVVAEQILHFDDLVNSSAGSNATVTSSVDLSGRAAP